MLPNPYFFRAKQVQLLQTFFSRQVLQPLAASEPPAKLTPMDQCLGWETSGDQKSYTVLQRWSNWIKGNCFPQSTSYSHVNTAQYNGSQLALGLPGLFQQICSPVRHSQVCTHSGVSPPWVQDVACLLAELPDSLLRHQFFSLSRSL